MEGTASGTDSFLPDLSDLDPERLDRFCRYLTQSAREVLDHATHEAKPLLSSLDLADPLDRARPLLEEARSGMVVALPVSPSSVAQARELMMREARRHQSIEEDALHWAQAQSLLDQELPFLVSRAWEASK